MKRIISTQKAPAAIGPYSQAIEINGVLYTSGQIAIDPITGKIKGNTVAEQSEQVLNNIKSILSEAGYGLEHVVKTTVFLTDLSFFGEMNEVYGRIFGDHKPARSAVEVSALPKGALIEIETVSMK